MNNLVLKNVEVMSHDEGYTAVLGFCPSVGAEDTNMKVYCGFGGTEKEAVNDLARKMADALNILIKK